MATAILSPVSFHGNTLFITDHCGEPYTPMKPIVEGMGMAWQSQQRKLTENKERWGIIILVIPSNGGMQEMICMPVRKLPAFFASISVNKVREELRPTITLFQNECDDALWSYWTAKHAERQATPLPAPTPALDAPITPDQQCTLQAIVKAKVEAIPETERNKGLFPQIWGRFKNHFRVAKYDQLPQSRMSEAVAYLSTMEVRQKALPAPEPEPAPAPAMPDYFDRQALTNRMEQCFAAMRYHAQAMRENETEIFEIIRKMRGHVLNVPDKRRSAFVNMGIVRDDLFYTIDHAVKAAEFHAKTMCVMSQM